LGRTIPSVNHEEQDALRKIRNTDDTALSNNPYPIEKLTLFQKCFPHTLLGQTIQHAPQFPDKLATSMMVTRYVSKNGACQHDTKPTFPTKSVATSDIGTFITNVAWATHSTYHTVLKASPGGAIFGEDMLFDIPFLADWNKIGDYKQCLTDLNTEYESKTHQEWDYQLGDKVLLRKVGILHKSEIHYERDPWTITSVHTMAQLGFNPGQNQND
jgi:hypothetical protein